MVCDVREVQVGVEGVCMAWSCCLLLATMTSEVSTTYWEMAESMPRQEIIRLKHCHDITGEFTTMTKLSENNKGS